jgi:6-phospho-beta-glucosidase
MKLTFIGAGGVRTPLVIESVLGFQSRIPFTKLCLMDIDAERLKLIRMVSEARLRDVKPNFEIEWTTDAREAITGSDFVVMTFRQGGIASRVIDEGVPLKYEVLGQETTGPGGFAMAMRTIPVLLEYVQIIRELAPQAWLINFSNPAGILTEAVANLSGFNRVVGICDNPSSMERSIAAHLQLPQESLFFEYYGLNHLGWLSGVYTDGINKVPQLIDEIVEKGSPWHWLPFDPGLIESLGVIPNEYLLFYYYPRRSVENYIKAGQSRAQQIQPFNQSFYAELQQIEKAGADPDEAMLAFTNYLEQRHGSYMTIETGEAHEEYENQDGDGVLKHEEDGLDSAAEGYSGVALRLIEALTQKGMPAKIILNVPNRGALPDMADDDVVEVTCFVQNGIVRPFAMGHIPDHAAGLMKRVKAYERLTIQAASEKSYKLALKALALHPLMPSYEVAESILNDYIEAHGKYFPSLN